MPQLSNLSVALWLSDVLSIANGKAVYARGRTKSWLPRSLLRVSLMVRNELSRMKEPSGARTFWEWIRKMMVLLASIVFEFSFSQGPFPDTSRLYASPFLTIRTFLSLDSLPSFKLLF